MTVLARRAGAICGCVIVVTTALAGLVCVVFAIGAMVFGLRPIIFRSGSMEPAISTGSVAISREVPAAALRVGDIVTVTTASGTRVTHRISALTHRPGSATLQLRGDANDADDSTPYTVRSAYRVIFAVPGAGYVLAWLASPPGTLFVGAYVGGLLVLVLRRRPRRLAARPVVLGLAFVIVIGSGGLVPTMTTRTLAAWTDDATVSGTSLRTLNVVAPATFTCGLLGVNSVTFNWSAVQGATSYTLHYGQNGTSTRKVTSPSTSAKITALISGGTAWVQANREFASTTWTSAPSQTRTYTVAVLSLCA